MSIFQTVVEIPEYRMKTGYGKNNLFIGSCFTESIGEKMQQLKFTIDLNPFGILYNPVSIANGIRILMSGKHFSESDLINFNGLWQDRKSVV